MGAIGGEGGRYQGELLKARGVVAWRAERECFGRSFGWH